MMSSEKKCAECTRRGKPCVRTSWEALDQARESLSDNIAADEKKREQLIAELSNIQARIERNRVVRAQAEERSKEKMACFMRELEAAGDPILLEDVSATEFGVQSLGIRSPFAWDDPAFWGDAPVTEGGG